MRLLLLLFLLTLSVNAQTINVKNEIIVDSKDVKVIKVHTIDLFDKYCVIRVYLKDGRIENTTIMSKGEGVKEVARIYRDLGDNNE